MAFYVDDFLSSFRPFKHAAPPVWPVVPRPRVCACATTREFTGPYSLHTRTEWERERAGPVSVVCLSGRLTPSRPRRRKQICDIKGKKKERTEQKRNIPRFVGTLQRGGSYTDSINSRPRTDWHGRLERRRRRKSLFIFSSVWRRKPMGEPTPFFLLPFSQSIAAQPERHQHTSTTEVTTELSSFLILGRGMIIRPQQHI